MKFILAFIALVVLATPISTTTATADSSYLTYDQLKAYTEKQAEQQWSAQLVAYAQTLVGKRTGTCVLSLRNHFGVPRNEVQGAAKTTKINSTTGKVGAVIVFRNLSKWGHVGYIIADDGDNWLYFHSNYDFRGTGRIDRIAKTDKKISGYRIINYN